MVGGADCPQDVIAELDAAWGGRLIEVGKTLYMRSGANRLPLRTIGPDDIMRRVEVRVVPPLQQRAHELSAGLAQSNRHTTPSSASRR